MNTIPTVSNDSALMPKTGSGSPQTPPQQRADAVPTVLSDSDAIRADPGVMLKVVPPTTPRDGALHVGSRDQQQGLSLTDLLQLFAAAADETGDIAIESAAARADQLAAKRALEIFASLPKDVQELVESASNPAIAKLLRLAAITAPGIKEAPARVNPSSSPIAMRMEDVPAALLLDIESSPAFSLARLVRTLVPFASASSLAPRQAPMPGEGSSLSPQQNFSGTGASHQATLPQVNTPQTAANLPHLQSHQQESALPIFQSNASSLQQQGNGGVFNDGSVGAGEVRGERQQVNLTNTSQAFGALMLNQQDSADQFQTNPSLPHATMTYSQAEAEVAIKDALRILMDGRILWTGELLPDLKAHFERRDAWRADRRSPGGVHKGTSLRLLIDLPNLGPLEIRATGFGGQAILRLHATSGSTPTFSGAISSLQERLKAKGLQGAQVILDSI